MNRTVKNRMPKIFGGLILVAMLAAVFPSASNAESRKGLAVRFGGVASPFGEAVKGYEDTRFYRHFAFGGDVYFRYALGENTNWGWAISFDHLVNDVRQGGTVIATLAQYPITAKVSGGMEWGEYAVSARVGGGVSISSLGNGTLLNQIELERTIAIDIATDTGIVGLIGASFEYELSPLTTLTLDTDLWMGSIKTDWKVTGEGDKADIPYQDADLYVRHFAVMIGVQIDLFGGGEE